MIKNITKIYINRITKLHNTTVISIVGVQGYSNCIRIQINWRQGSKQQSGHITIKINKEDRIEFIEYLRKRMDSMFQYTYYQMNYDIGE